MKRSSCFLKNGAILAVAVTWAGVALGEEDAVAASAVETGVVASVEGAVAADAEVAGETLVKTGWATPGRLALGALFNDAAHEYSLDGYVPLWAPAGSRVFLDLRGTAIESDEQELSAGLIGRHLFEDRSVILGASFMADSRWTEYDNRFDQVGAGVELLSRWVDARFNYYYPLSDEETLELSTATGSDVRSETAGKVTTTTTTTYARYEEALQGLDFEIGAWLPFLDEVAPTGLFAGYYDYESDYSSDLSGMKARLECRVHPQVTLDAEWREDSDVSQGEIFGGVRVLLPLDFWNGASTSRDVASSGQRHALEYRLSEQLFRTTRVRTLAADGDVPVSYTVDETLDPAHEPVCRIEFDGNGDPVVVCE